MNVWKEYLSFSKKLGGAPTPPAVFVRFWAKQIENPIVSFSTMSNCNCVKIRRGKIIIETVSAKKEKFNDLGHLAKREKQKVDTAQAIMKIIKVKTVVNG